MVGQERTAVRNSPDCSRFLCAPGSRPFRGLCNLGVTSSLGWIMLRSRRVRVGLLVALAVATDLLVWLALPSGNHRPRGAPVGTVDVSASRLRGLIAVLTRPVYWAGPRSDVTYEFTQAGNDRTYVRYLPRGVEAGSPRRFLTIGTYLLANAFAATESVARRPGQARLPIGAGGVAFYSHARPTRTSRSRAATSRSRSTTRRRAHFEPS
jgi:hypothetical protein